ncbi:MAG: tRNA 2-selenouridine(34) synthase MnmH [Pseudomonadota bacterium]
MAFSINDHAALWDASFDTIIDVRSPAEFAEDHVPGAINLPVLSDEERAHVGTVYVQDSPFKARKIGAALVAKNAAKHLEGPLAGMDGGWRPLVYCWRGGQRSGSFASILSQIGWRVETLTGGYQSYRRMVVNSLYERELPCEVILLDGNTGTAKTELLTRLPDLGVQTLDLEHMANHRGSALGGQGAQPSQKAFESRLSAALARLDPTRPVLVEAESSRVGRLNVPPRLFAAMRGARRVAVDAPVAARAHYLCRAYADLTQNPELLIERLSRLTRLQGHDRVRIWSRLATEGQYHALASALIEHHYDPSYAKLRKAMPAPEAVLRAESLDPAGIDLLACKVAKAVNGLAAHQCATTV